MAVAKKSHVKGREVWIENVGDAEVAFGDEKTWRLFVIAVDTERERCAKVCEEIANTWDDLAAKAEANGKAQLAAHYCGASTAARECAAAIRRGE